MSPLRRILRHSSLILALLLALYILSFGPAQVYLTTPDTFLYQFYRPILFLTQVPVIGDLLGWYATVLDWVIGG